MIGASIADVPAANARITVRRGGEPDGDGTCVVYWMQRTQRASDNPALDVAVEIGNRLQKPVVAFFGLNPFIERANLRHYTFLVEGLADIESGLRRRRVGFVLRRYPEHGLLKFLDEIRPVAVVSDENPLRQTEGWRRKVTGALRVPFWTVDADVVVPTKLLLKEQYAARTIRPRINVLLPAFLDPGTNDAAQVPWRRPVRVASRPIAGILDGLPIDRSVLPVTTWVGGRTQARRRLQTFVRQRLDRYDEARNHPEDAGTSELSPYLHFGHLGPREVAVAILDSGAPEASTAAFLEQLIVRRELAVNFVAFNPHYDRLDGCERWAIATLHQHRRDRRAFEYDWATFEAAATHDPLWNAAQRQMVSTGWMHGYVRMYWAKKILEWTRDAEEAFDVAVRLNDKYFLDGRDPNGYTNIAWAIGGKHDRPWPSRPIYGTIRSMTLVSTARKFDSARYIERWSP
jgi:deoxyribodipyrimidine photo-lyase